MDPSVCDGFGDVDGHGVIEVIDKDLAGLVILGDAIRQLLCVVGAKEDVGFDPSLLIELMDFGLGEPKADALIEDAHFHGECLLTG